MRFYKLALGCVVVASALSQTRVDLRTQAKSVDFSGASSTKPSQTGTVLPATCSIGQTFFNTAATAGQNLFACTSVNVWTLEGGSGGSNISSVFGRTGAVTAQSGDYSAAQISGLAPSATSDTTNAANISSGTLPAARLPVPGAAALGGVQSKDCSAGGQFVQKINSDGTETCGTPAGGGNVSGPGTVTNGYLPQWGAGNNLLTTGLAVSTAAAANTVPEAGAGGTLAAGWLPGAGSHTVNTTAPLSGGAAVALGGTLTLSCPTCLTANAVPSVFGRSGAVTAQSGDYSAAQILGLAASATTDTTNAANISSGTLPPARLPAPGAVTLGGVQSKDCSAGGQFLQKINSDGTTTCATASNSGPALTTGTGYPHGNCAAGDSFTQTDAASGQSVWVCGPANMWTNQASGLISSGAALSTSGRVWTFDMMTPGSGTTLIDLSSAGHNGTFSCSGYGNPSWGATGMVFAGSQCLSAPFTGAAGWTVCYATGNPTSVQATLLAGSNNNSWMILSQWDGVPRWGGYSFPNVKLAQSPGGNHCLSAVYGTTPGATHVYWDGVESTYATNIANPTSNDSTLGIGGLPGFSGYGYSGTIYYATSYTAAPAASTIKADVASIAYILSTRGIFLNNTNNTVYVIGMGDSIMDGFTADEPLHAISGHIPFATFLQFGVAQMSESTIATKFPAWLPASVYSPMGRTWVAVDQGGTNDMCLSSGQEPATLVSRKTVASGVHAAGGKILWISILPRSGCGNANFASDRAALNSAMATGWIGFADGYTGFEADPVIGTGSIYTTNAACSSDGTHPSNGFCNSLYGQYIEDGIRTLLGLPFPRLLASTTLTAQTASIGSTALVTGPAPGSYRIWETLVPTAPATSGTGCSITATLGWTDPSGTKTSVSSSVSLTTLNSGAFVSTPALISSGNITYSTTLTSGTCSGEQYQLYVRADSY